MTVKELLEFLQPYADANASAKIVLAKDPEGNGYYPLDRLEAGFYLEWDREYYSQLETFKPDNTEPCVCLWPGLSPMEDKALANIFLEAIHLLETEGWIQEKMHSTEGYCLVGALYESGDAYGLSYRYLRDNIKDENLFLWNDARGRTKEEVIELLVAAAKELDPCFAHGKFVWCEHCAPERVDPDGA